MKWIVACASLLTMTLALCGCGQPATNNAQLATDHFVEGQLALDSNDYDAALAELRKAIQADPSLSVAHAAIGDIYRKQGHLDQAAEAYQQAVQTNPYAFRPRYNLGMVYQSMGEMAKDAAGAAESIKKAIDAYLAALSLEPKDFDANVNLAACYFDQGQYDLAEKYAKAAIAIDPNSALAKYNLGLIYEAANRPYEAIRSFKDSLELDVHQPKLLLALGRVYIKLNRLRDAQKVFELAAKDAPESAEAWEQVGLAAYYEKKYDEAGAAYKKSTEIDATRASAFRGLGVVCMTQFVESPPRTELRDQALDAWNRSLELDSNQPELAQLVKKYTPALTKPAL